MKNKKKRGKREQRKKTGRTNLGKRRTKQRRKGSVKTNSQKASIFIISLAPSSSKKLLRKRKQ
jgi:hypothetical protein